jgi:hypothetical protein
MFCSMPLCNQLRRSNPDHQQGIICGVAFARSSLRRIMTYASVVAPRRLAFNTLLMIRIFAKSPDLRLFFFLTYACEKILYDKQ